jgi:putative transcriptional regulator
MSTNGTGERDLRVLRSKRDASRYQILVAIADRQPAVSQQEIADTVGITAQAVSDYVQELVEEGYVETRGRGRYEVTKEGVDWLISRTDDLREFTQFVSEEVIGQVETETAIATDDIETGERVTLSMTDGTLCATPNGSGSATALAITNANEGQDVGVTDFEGLHEYDIGEVTMLVVPDIRDGGSRAVEHETVAQLAAEHDFIAVSGTEALATARSADVTPDLRFGTVSAVPAAAARGIPVLLLVTDAGLSRHTERLRENGVGYELVDERG